jgi:serine protease Do
MRHRLFVGLALGLAVGLSLGILGTGLAGSSPNPVVPASLPMDNRTFAKLAEAVKPAVINVNTESRGGRTAVEEFHGEEFFKRFFGDAPERLPRRSLGSGVVIDPSGLALTNAHVVERASQIEVAMLDGSKYKAKLVGVDRKTDLAVLKLEANGKTFPFLRLADSDETRVGDWVIAVGSPFGLQATVTSGIISAKARQLGAGPYDDFLQTDAAINPGNSGGPLVNMRGEVVGINTAMVKGGSGIGFAIPANMVKRVSSELQATGKVTRGWLGVSLQALTADLAASFGTRDAKGALVAEVVAGSPAAKAGLKSGDVITRFNGEPVDDPGELARLVGMAKPGQSTALTVWRDKRELKVDVTLAPAPGERARARLGLEVRPVTADVARELNLRSADGVVVSAVETDSAADAAGLQQGDVIVEIDRQPVNTVSDFERLTGTAQPDRPLTFRIHRGGGSLYVAVTPERADRG